MKASAQGFPPADNRQLPFCYLNFCCLYWKHPLRPHRIRSAPAADITAGVRFFLLFASVCRQEKSVLSPWEVLLPFSALSAAPETSRYTTAGLPHKVVFSAACHFTILQTAYTTALPTPDSAQTLLQAEHFLCKKDLSPH